MSEENKNIDQLFSDAAHSEKAPQYDSAYWAEMNEMLNARDAKKRRFFLWAFGGSAAFAVLLLSLFTFNYNDSTQINKRYAQEEVNTEMKSAPLNADDYKSLKNNKSVLSEESTSTKEPNQTGVESTNTSGRKENQFGTSNSSKENKITPLAEVETAESKDLSYKNQSQSVEAKQSSADTFEGMSTENNVKSAKEAQIGNKNNSIIERKEAQVSEDEENRATNNFNASLPFVRKTNLSQNETNHIVKSRNELKPRSKYNFYGKISAGLMENYKTSRPYESGLIDVSINAEANFNSVLIRTGLGTQLTTNADLIVSQRAKVYGFGVTNHQNDLSYQNLFDVYIPLEIGYQYKKSSFGVGAQANYLVTSSMDLNHYENNFLIKTEQYSGNTNGLNTFTTQGYVWFEHKFTPLITGGLKVGTNISGRIKDDAYFNNSATTNPIYGQLSLRINFSK